MKKFLVLFMFVLIFPLIGCEGERGESIVGPSGFDGADGVSGINGVDGVNGVNGQDGVDGIDGANGADGVDGVPQCAPGKTWNPNTGHCRIP